MTRSRAEFHFTMDLVLLGLNDCEVARATGIPRTTIRDWRSGQGPNKRAQTDHDGTCADHDPSEIPSRAYSYLLGIYLGDGYIAAHPRAYRLRVSMDAQYFGIIEEVWRAMEAVMPGQEAHLLHVKNSRCIEISMYSNHWPCLFPQHGPGRKHDRKIDLASWQAELLDDEMFIRGLIHSDGCRITANDRGVPSIRYHFTNVSEDIKALYCAALDRLGITWTRPCNKQIAIYRKAAVAKMDLFVGPKT
jgi:hypothetical protein